MTYLLRFLLLLLRLLLVCVLALGLGGLAAAAPGRSGEAVLEVANQEIVTFRGSYDGTSPAARVDRALGRIQDLEARHLKARSETFQVGRSAWPFRPGSAATRT